MPKSPKTIAMNAREARAKKRAQMHTQKRAQIHAQKRKNKTKPAEAMVVDSIKKEDNMITDDNHQPQDIQHWHIKTLDYIFNQVDSGTLQIDEIKKNISDLGFKIFDEALVQAFFNEASLEGVRGFLKSSSKLKLNFSLERFSQKVICNEAFFYPNLSKIFWDKRVCLYQAFPCHEILKNHLVKLDIIPAQSSFAVTKCISKKSKEFLVQVGFGCLYIEEPFYKCVTII